MAKAQTEKETAEEKLPAEKVDLNNEESRKLQDGAKYTCQKDQVLYLFGRTGREKEEWFRRFLLASKLKSETKKPPSLCGSKPGTQILYFCRSLLKETNQNYVLVVPQWSLQAKNNTKDTLLLILASHCHLPPTFSPLGSMLSTIITIFRLFYMNTLFFNDCNNSCHICKDELFSLFSFL